ncbi:GDSL esterase/lipase [Forsythia ovata]|uniref:GDSL esterase/lipase n=1 Tax=Forsythia ovata TaxID=205694 RepID=A0ABD1WEI3_9LAMI
MAKLIYQSLALAFLFSLFLSPSSAHYKSQEASNLPVDFKGSFNQVFAFGDSYTDTGNAKFLGGFNFSGDTKNIPLDWLKNIKQGGDPASRMSNGQLVVDFLCKSLSLPTLAPYKDPSANFSVGVNFAIAGSTSLPSDYFLGKNLSSLIWKGVPKNFQTQIEWFNNFLTKSGCKGKNIASCKVQMHDSLFWIGEMGVNDYTRAHGSSVSLQSLSEMSVRTVSKLLKTLLTAGAKYIVVQGLPPVGCLPMDIFKCPLHKLNKMGCAAAVNSAIMIHNQILQRNLEKIRKLNPKSTIVYADYWNAFLTILTNPKKYQIEEPFKACCGSSGTQLNFNSHSLCGSPGTTVCKDPSKHINWDGIHLTEAMYKHVTDLFLNQGFCRPSFDDLIKSKKSM